MTVSPGWTDLCRSMPVMVSVGSKTTQLQGNPVRIQFPENVTPHTLQ